MNTASEKLPKFYGGRFDVQIDPIHIGSRHPRGHHSNSFV